MTLTVEAARHQAITRGNRIRVERSVFKRRIKQAGRAGAAELAEVVLDPPAMFGSLYVWQFVNWAPLIGDARAREMLRAAGIDPWHRVRRLTPRQRQALADSLREHATGAALRKHWQRTCRECGESMSRRSDDGRCGFCQEGLR